MIMRLILGGAIGSVIGAVVGYIGKCSGGACPLTCNPIGGTLVGLIIGVIIATSGSLAPSSSADTVSKHVIEVQDGKQLQELLTANKVILVDFYADWCGPCRRLKPIIHEIADEYAGRVVVASVNVDNLKDVAEKYGVYSIPDVRVFRAGKVSDSFIGVRSKKTYTEILDKVPAPATNG